MNIINQNPITGIDDVALYIPALYLPIQTLSETRAIVYDKLNKGLGLQNMAITDTDEDTATMAASAVALLIDKNNLNPTTIGRLYIGTESAIDGAKPTATYVLEMLTQRYAPRFGEDCFAHCDVLDMTLACVGGVDALHNTLDWAAAGSNRIGIVVSADNAKYELASSGEYTQGAGAIALLIQQNPRLLSIKNTWGVSSKSVHDFYKPRRTFSKRAILEELNQYLTEKIPTETLLQAFANSLEHHGFWDSNEDEIAVHKDTPVFDGQYSNQCYQDRVADAYEHFCTQSLVSAPALEEWKHLIFHLPYAYHGRRIWMAMYVNDLQTTQQWDAFAAKFNIVMPTADDAKTMANFYKSIAQTEDYQAFVHAKIERGERASSQVGNMYTGSVFLALISTLYAAYQENSDLTHQKIGFLSYGSGSKSKVFEAIVQPDWSRLIARLSLEQLFAARTAVDYDTYEALHTGKQKDRISTRTPLFWLTHANTPNCLVGTRSYSGLAV